MEYKKPIDLYHEARKRGRALYNSQKAKGESGHLTSLDGVLKDVEIVSNVSLGLQEVELKRVVGTYYHSKRMNFSKDFYPLQQADTDFADQWMIICDEYVQNGIKDPVIVYEYLNHYYVIEGNKRVSVLKHFGEQSVKAYVYRMIPKFDPDDIAIKTYYAFLDFQEKTGIYSIWLSKPSRFKRLENYLENFNPKILEAKDKYDYFEKYIYQPFRRIFLDYGGDRLPGTTGDAFVLYLKLYGVPEHIDESHLKEVMIHLLKEVSYYVTEEETEIIEESELTESGNFVSQVTSMLYPKTLRVGFVYARSVEDSAWTYAHELGRKELEKKFGKKVMTGYIDQVPEDKRSYEIIKDFAKDYDVVFTTSEVFRRATVTCAMELPEVYFFNCSGNKPYASMNNYFGRTYESRFLTGVVAGAMTQTNEIGYTASDPTAEVISSINAFTLGARMVNPSAKVHVMWTGEWNNPQKTTDLSKQLMAYNVDVMSNKTLEVPRDVTKDYGVYSMLCQMDLKTQKATHYLAAPIWHWGTFYEKIVDSILTGSYSRALKQKEKSSDLVHFWWGMDSGVVDIYLDESGLPSQLIQLVELLKQNMINRDFQVFSGEIKDHEGVIRCDKKKTLSHKDILQMDWFVEGVCIHNP